jgi:hypothetical protein
MADLFAEGKGLDKALSDHLAAQKDRIELIERGGIRAFRIVPREGVGGVRPEGGDAPPADADLGPASPTGASDDDIPF